MTMDPLSDVLRSVRLVGGVFVDAQFTAPWCVTANMSAEDTVEQLAAPVQLIAYHLVVEGSLLLEIPGEPWVQVGAGEVVLLPRNDSHVLASAPGVPAVRAGTLIQMSSEGGLGRISHGGGGPATRVICGFLGSEEGYNPLIASLPSVLTVDLRQAASRDWIEASLRFAAGELAAGRLASSATTSRLSELMLVEAVRHYAERLGEAELGWLRGMKDPQIGRALALIHRDISASWTAEALARAVAMSRSAFMDRFAALVGTPPIRYLTQWRMQAARQQLRETTKPVRQIGHAIGSESEEAFSRAFKREFGAAPAHWRARNAAQPPRISPSAAAPVRPSRSHPHPSLASAAE